MLCSNIRVKHPIVIQPHSTMQYSQPHCFCTLYHKANKRAHEHYQEYHSFQLPTIFKTLHGMQSYPVLVKLEKVFRILKCIQYPRKFQCDHFYVSVVNPVQLKEIKQVIFTWTSGIFQT